MPSKGGITDEEKLITFVEYMTGLPAEEYFEFFRRKGVKHLTLRTTGIDNRERAEQIKAVRDLFAKLDIAHEVHRGERSSPDQTREIFLSFTASSDTLLLGALVRAYPEKYEAFQEYLKVRKLLG
jgi:hypothetical protein